MKIKILLLLLLLVTSNSSACPFHPFSNVERFVEQMREDADIIIFGKLTMLEQRKNGAQTAEFYVIKSFKGDVSGSLTIINATMSSCFYPFETLDSAYYIFATKTEVEGVYEITNKIANGFVSLEWAVERDWDWGIR